MKERKNPDTVLILNKKFWKDIEFSLYIVFDYVLAKRQAISVHHAGISMSAEPLRTFNLVQFISLTQWQCWLQQENAPRARPCLEEEDLVRRELEAFSIGLIDTKSRNQSSSWSETASSIAFDSTVPIRRLPHDPHRNLGSCWRNDQWHSAPYHGVNETMFISTCFALLSSIDTWIHFSHEGL